MTDQTTTVPNSHNYAEYGSLASPCLICRLPFALAGDSRNWTGRSCPGRALTPAELFALDREWCAAYPR